MCSRPQQPIPGGPTTRATLTAAGGGVLARTKVGGGVVVRGGPLITKEAPAGVGVVVRGGTPPRAPPNNIIGGGVGFRVGGWSVFDV